jgi:hypothetical protein
MVSVMKWVVPTILTILLSIVAQSAQSSPRLTDREIKDELRTYGPGLWILNRNIKRPSETIRYAQATGHRHILPLADGRGGDKRAIMLLAENAQNSGIKVMPWVYLTPINQQTRMAALSELCDGGNISAVMINIEHRRSDYSLDKLSEQISEFRKRYPNILVEYTGYNLPQTHRYVGTNRLLTMVDFWSPQVYWSHNGSTPKDFFERGELQWKGVLAEIDRPDMAIVPVGNVYWSDKSIQEKLSPESVAELNEFVDLVKEKGYPGYSWYLYDEVSKMGWATRGVISANQSYNGNNSLMPLILVFIWVVAISVFCFVKRRQLSMLASVLRIYFQQQLEKLKNRK